MKSVDVTLVIQAFNFFIAYAILRRYVFTPAAQILEKEEQLEQQLQSAIDESLRQKNISMVSMKQRLLEIKQLLQKSVPAIEPEVLPGMFNQQQELLQKHVVLPDQQCQKIKKIISDSVSEVTL